MQKRPQRHQFSNARIPVGVQGICKGLYPLPQTFSGSSHDNESGNGVQEIIIHKLAQQSNNNHFGIKCHSTWTGKRTYHDDDEKGECFRVYDDAKDSYEDHSHPFCWSHSCSLTIFPLPRHRYARLFELDPWSTDYKGWAEISMDAVPLASMACRYATK